jgi:septum formation protein
MSSPLVLASTSKERKRLIAKLGFVPDFVVAPDIQEIKHPSETNTEYVVRLAFEKSYKVANQFDDGLIIAADTIVVCKENLLEKAENKEQIESYLQQSSGNINSIYTAVHIIKKVDGNITQQLNNLVKSKIKFKVLTKDEIDVYVNTGEGIGKSGGFAVMGCASHFIEWLCGSISAIEGLPLYQTYNMLKELNFVNKIICQD